MSDFIHAVQNFCHAWKQCYKSFTGSPFSAVLTLLWISPSGPKWVPFESPEYENMKNSNDGQPSNTGIYLLVSLFQWKCCVRMYIFMMQNSLVRMKIWSFSTSKLQYTLLNFKPAFFWDMMQRLPTYTM